MRQKSREDLKHVSAYISKTLFDRTHALADQDHWSMSSEIVVLLEKATEMAAKGGEGSRGKKS